MSFPVCRVEILEAINCTGSAEGALVPVLLRITHWPKSRLPVSPTGLFPPWNITTWARVMDYFSFHEGVCPVCLESGGEKLPCCEGKIHPICIQDWIWLQPSDRCPCCNQGLAWLYMQLAVVAWFQRNGETRVNLIAVSNHLLTPVVIKICK